MYIFYIHKICLNQCTEQINRILMKLIHVNITFKVSDTPPTKQNLSLTRITMQVLLRSYYFQSTQHIEPLNENCHIKPGLDAQTSVLA